MKKYNVMFNVGKVKYVINHHDGKQKHKDGSEYFGISTFRNKREFNKACKSLEMQGYVYGN